MRRTELREHAFKLLFGVEFNDKSELREQMELYMDLLEDLSGKDREDICAKVQAASERLTQIDGMINARTTGWKTTRMNKVDLTILRLAVYEMEWDPDVPVSVAISEAVLLAQKFGGEGSPAFVNGVLAKIAK